MILYTTRVLNQIFLGYIKKTKIIVTQNNNKLDKSYIVPFTCGFTDIDTYLHINNSKYLHIAELARWRVFPQSGLLQESISKGMMFLAVEQSIVYLKPIFPFQKYIVRTRVSVKDDKWMMYYHTFEQHPDLVVDGKSPVEYAKIELKAVLKEKNGKTIRPEEMMRWSEFYRELLG